MARALCAGCSIETSRSVAGAAARLRTDPQVCVAATAVSLGKLQLFSGSWVCLKLHAGGQGVENMSPGRGAPADLDFDFDSCVVARAVMVRHPTPRGGKPGRRTCAQTEREGGNGGEVGGAGGVGAGEEGLEETEDGHDQRQALQKREGRAERRARGE